MADIGRLGGIVHRVGQVAAQSYVEAPPNHLLDGKRPVENAHIRVHAHDEDILDASLMINVIEFLSII